MASVACSPTPANKGVALITVMLVVALATTAAVAMASRQQLDIRRSENTLYHGQAMMYALGMEQWVQQILYSDHQDSQTDHLGEDWATVLSNFGENIEGGSLSGQLEDLQGRFNLNNLHQPGNPGIQAATRFRRLLITLDLNPNLVRIIQDWLDSDQNARIPGAEDVDYLGLQPAYRTADRMMQSPSELLLLKDMSREDYDTLLPFVCTLPYVTPINVNTASAEVLMTLDDNLSPSDVQQLVDQRNDEPFNSVQDFLSANIFAGLSIPDDVLSVNSDFFVLRGEVRFSHVRQQLRVIYMRDQQTGRTDTLMRAEGEL